MIKAIVFDLDDTLYDEMQFVKGGFKEVSVYISKKYNLDEDKIFKTLLLSLEKYGRGKTFDITLKKLNLFDKKIIPKLVNVYRTHKPNLSLYPEVIKVLSLMKKQGYLIGLITDGNIDAQKNKVKSLKIKDFFDCMIFSDEYGTGKQKPNPFPYKKAVEELKVSEEETIYVADDPNKDFVTAKKMGMHTIRMLRGRYKDIKMKKEFEAEHQIKNLTEIFDTIDIIGKN